MKLTIFYLMLKKIIKFYNKYYLFVYIQQFLDECEYLKHLTNIREPDCPYINLIHGFNSLLDTYERVVVYGDIYDFKNDERIFFDNKETKQTIVDNKLVISFLQELSDAIMNNKKMGEHIRDKICWYIEKQKRIYILNNNI